MESYEWLPRLGLRSHGKILLASDFIGNNRSNIAEEIVDLTLRGR
jgi:hypothetical protein